MYEKILFNPERIGVFMFFASIPGAYIITGVLIYLLIFAKNQIMAHVTPEETK